MINRRKDQNKSGPKIDRSKLLIFGLVIVAAVMGADMVFNSAESQDVVVVGGKVVSTDDSEKSPAAASTVSTPTSLAGSVPSPLPGRMVGVPNYDTTMFAGRIINEAINTEAAKAFIGLQTTRRNVRIQSEIATLTAKIKEAEASTAEAEQRIRDAKRGVTKSHSLEVANNQIPTDLQPVNGSDSGVKAIAPERIWRLTGFDSISGDMTFQYGERWYRGVKSGQTIEGNLVGDIDRKLRCVPLTKDTKTTVICLN